MLWPTCLNLVQQFKLTYNSGADTKGPHKGNGLVEFEDPGDIKDAIDNMDQAELFGKVIKVRKAVPPKNVNEGLGSRTALWEQVCFMSAVWSGQS